MTREPSPFPTPIPLTRRQILDAQQSIAAADASNRLLAEQLSQAGYPISQIESMLGVPPGYFQQDQFPNSSLPLLDLNSVLTGQVPSGQLPIFSEPSDFSSQLSTSPQAPSQAFPSWDSSFQQSSINVPDSSHQDVPFVDFSAMFPAQNLPPSNEAFFPVNSFAGYNPIPSNEQFSPVDTFPSQNIAPSNEQFTPVNWFPTNPQPSLEQFSPVDTFNNSFTDPLSGQVPSSGEITDNPFADSQWTQTTSDSSPGTITDNPFSDPSWLPSQSQPSPAQSAYDPSLGSVGQPGGVSTVQGTIVGDNGMYYRFDPTTGTYQSTGVQASASGAYGGGGGWQNTGYGSGSVFGAGWAGSGGAGFGGYGGLGGSGAPQFSGGGFVDTSTPAGLSHGGSDPSAGGSGGWVPPSAAAALKMDAPGVGGKYATAQARHGG